MQNLIAFLSVSPLNCLSNLSLEQRKAVFILVIVEINGMTQRKEKTGICKSVVVAIVVAIRDVVKIGFHCIFEGEEISFNISLPNLQISCFMKI